VTHYGGCLRGGKQEVSRSETIHAISDILHLLPHLIRCLGDRVADRLHDDVDHHGDEREADEEIDGSGEEELWMSRNDIPETVGDTRAEVSHIVVHEEY